MKSLKVMGICGFILVFCGAIGAMERFYEIRASAGNPSAYAQAHALDPLFAFPGSEINKLSEAVNAFEISAKIALPPFPEGEETRQHLYPFRFLTAIAAAEEARKQVLIDPTFEHATTYHTSLLTLITAHEEDLNDAVTLLAKDSSNAQYQLFSGKTTANHLRSVLTEALHADEAAKEKENARFKCLLGTITSCESLTTLRLQFGSKDTLENVPAPEEIPNEIEKNREALDVVYPTIATSTIISLTHSACFTDSPAYFAVVGGVSRLSKLPTIQPVYLSDLYLEDVRTSTQPFYSALRKNGDSFTYQPFRVYMCPDAGVDFGKTVAIQQLHDALTRTPFVFKTSISPLLQKVAAAQKKLTEAPFLTDIDYSLFNNSTIDAVRGLDQKTLTQAVGGHEEALRLMEAATKSETNSDNFEGVIGYFDDLQIGGSIIYDMQSSPTLVYFISRGGLSQLYALNNATVFPSPQPLITQRAANIRQTKEQGVPYVSYMEARDTEPALFDIRSLLVHDIPIRTRVLSVPLTKLQNARATYLQTYLQSCKINANVIIRVPKEKTEWTIPCGSSPLI